MLGPKRWGGWLLVVQWVAVCWLVGRCLLQWSKKKGREQSQIQGSLSFSLFLPSVLLSLLSNVRELKVWKQGGEMWKKEGPISSKGQLQILRLGRRCLHLYNHITGVVFERVCLLGCVWWLTPLILTLERQRGRWVFESSSSVQSTEQVPGLL